MILNERDKCVRGRTESWCTARCCLPKIRLSLKQIAVLGRRNKFLRSAKIIGVVGFPSPGQRDSGAMMEIVVPNRIEIITAFAARTDEFGDLPLVFRDQNNRVPFLIFAGSDRPEFRREAAEQGAQLSTNDMLELIDHIIKHLGKN